MTKLHLAAESCTVCSSRSRRPFQKLLDTPSYVKVFLFSLAQLYLILDNPEQIILEDRTGYLEHYMEKDRTRINFPKNDISYTEATKFYPKASWSNADLKTSTSATFGMKL
jgi:hypothetical protein